MGTAYARGALSARGALTRDHGGVCSVSIWSDKSANSSLCGGIRNSSHIYTRGTTTKALLCCCLFGSQKCLESFNSLVTRQAATDSAHFSLAAWGGHSPRCWCGAAPRRALLRSRGGGKCFDRECILTTNKLSAEFGIQTNRIEFNSINKK